MVFLENSMDMCRRDETDVLTQMKPASGQDSTGCGDDYVESVWGEDPGSLLSGACESLCIWAQDT